MSVTVLLSLKLAPSFCRRSLHSTASRHRWRKLLTQSFTAFWTSSDSRPRKLFAGLKTLSNPEKPKIKRSPESGSSFGCRLRLAEKWRNLFRFTDKKKDSHRGHRDLGVSLLSVHTIRLGFRRNGS